MIPKKAAIQVKENSEYRAGKAFAWTELAAIGIATVFATATGISTVYGPTFGSFQEYLGLFVWAAGAGTGGNLFKQLGTGSTPGGNADAALARPQ